MQTINLNPLHGIKQMSMGYFTIPRVVILELIKEKHLNLTELGYFIILITIADWDKGRFRNGFIRYEISELAKVLEISESSLYKYIAKFKKIGLITETRNVCKIENYKDFTLRGSQEISKVPLSIEKYLVLFPHLASEDSNIMEHAQANTASNFNNSFKSSLGDSLGVGLKRKEKS